MKKLCMIIAICFCGSQIIAQQSGAAPVSEDLSNDPKIVELQKHRAEVAENFAKQLGQSMYFGYDEILRSYFIDNIIPSTTPKSTGYSSKRDYVKILNQWLSENKQYLKPENKNVVITE